MYDFHADFPSSSAKVKFDELVNCLYHLAAARDICHGFLLMVEHTKRTVKNQIQIQIRLCTTPLVVSTWLPPPGDGRRPRHAHVAPL